MPTSDFFRTGAAPMASPFTDYMQPKTLSQQRAMQPSWLNVGHGGSGSPFGGNGGDISGAGWTNPIDLFTRQAEQEMAKLAGQGLQGGVPGGPGGASGGLSANGATPYDAMFVQAADEMGKRYGVQLDPALLKAMAHIESGGTFNNGLSRDDGFGDGLSVGIMQVKPSIWQHLVPDANPYDPLGNIRLGAAIMAQSIKQYGSWQSALTNVYFPVNDPNGTTQQMYVDQATQYMRQYSAGLDPNNLLRNSYGATGGGSGGVSSIFGGAGAPVGYEFDAPSVNGNMYNYAAAHGLSGMTHPGLDISVPRGTPLYSPGSGVVSCVGSADAGVGGTGGGSCGHFPDDDGGGIGNITIKLDNGTFVILGHSATASVRPGQRVTAGAPVGTSGGMYGSHTHLEVRVPDPSVPSGYRAVDPRSVLGQGAMGAPYQQGAPAQAQAYGSGSLFANWNTLMDPNAPWRSYSR